MDSRARASLLRPMSKIAAIILAAGQASRFRAAAGAAGPETKLVALLDGSPLVRHVAQAALASRARPVIVVTGHAQGAVRAALEGLPVTFVHNPEYATGLASSLQQGLAQVPPDCDGALVLLGDMPLINAPIIDELIDAFENIPDTKAVAPVRDGMRGNPVLLARALFSAVERLQGDVGARALLAEAKGDVLEVAIASRAVSYDVDTPEALASKD